MTSHFSDRQPRSDVVWLTIAWFAWLALAVFAYSTGRLDNCGRCCFTWDGCA